LAHAFLGPRALSPYTALLPASLDNCVRTAFTGTMGNTEVKFSPGEALDGSGLPVVLSDPIDDISTDQFWEMVVKYFTNRKPSGKGFEKEYTCKVLEDGGYQTTSTFEVTGLSSVIVGHIQGTINTKLYIDSDTNMMKIYVYPNDPTLAKESLATIAYLKAHSDPLRLEFWQEGQNWRAHGPILQGELADFLKKGGIEVEVLNGQPSPVDEGKKCVLTGPLPEGTTIEQLFEMRKQQAKDDSGAEEMPDGSVVVEKEHLTTAYYSVISMSEDKKSILFKDFGSDETLAHLKAITHTRLVPDPLRAEYWCEHMENHEGGPTAKNYIEPLVQNIFKFAKGESDEQ